MDSLESLMKGGDRGLVVVPGDPGSSLLAMAVSYDHSDLKMPPRGKIPEEDIAAVRQWIESLPPDPAIAAQAAAEAGRRQAVADAEQPPVGRPLADEPETAREETSVPLAAHAAPSETVETAQTSITHEQEQFFESKIRPLLVSNCYGCHTQAASGRLRLDSREALLKGGRDGVVVVPGKPEESLLVKAIHYESEIKMPPGGRLGASDVAAFEEWIRDGAFWPAPVAPAPKVSPKDREFWSFTAPVRPAVPEVTSPWVYNDVDRFILAKLEEKGLKPVGDADKRTLLRRVTYDLTGLPPTPDSVRAFLADDSPDAYRNLVERLLASKAYGERWGRKWLDLVRYADTSGAGGDNPIPQAVKYRDYVINAFHDDKPYNRFIREQLAGDLLPHESEEEHWQNVIATGYLAGAQRVEERNGYLADAVDNLGYTFLGLSVACARCHDHKFDPMPTADYYAIYGIMASTHFPSPGDGGPTRFQTGFTYRDPKVLEREDWKVFESQLDPVVNALKAVMRLPGTYDDLVPQLQVRRMNLFERAPDLGESAYAVREGEPKNVKIQIYGDPKNEGAEVSRGFLQVLAGSSLPETTEGSGRLELANWIADEGNPLTARVMVNRIWQGHFGRGIVATPNDFGTRGAAPSNQELLDFLASEFIASGWSVKAMHRQILLSHAYQLSSGKQAGNEKVDPENLYIWRHSRHRLEAEELRDSLLSMSGLLDRSPAGEHPFPPMHTWNYEEQNMFEADPADYETDRRTVYMMVQRTVRPQFFVLFDGPATNASTAERTSSLTPLQALYFMNGDFPKRAAEALASKLLDPAFSEKDAVREAFLTVYGRPAGDEELDRSISFLHNSADVFATKGSGSAEARKLAFEQFAKALFASNEFMFIE